MKGGVWICYAGLDFFILFYWDVYNFKMDNMVVMGRIKPYILEQLLLLQHYFMIIQLHEEVLWVYVVRYILVSF